MAFFAKDPINREGGNSGALRDSNCLTRGLSLASSLSVFVFGRAYFEAHSDTVFLRSDIEE
jgi:hypothetical protein